jgi:hypothetical protein
MDDDTDYGTNADSSPSYDYCAHCFQKGEFTIKTDSAEEFVEKMLEAMASDSEAPKMSKEEALLMLGNLERWKD